MSRREEDLLTLLQLKEAAKRVMMVVKKHRRKKHEAPQMPMIPSALLTIEEIEHLGEDYTFYIFARKPMRCWHGASKGLRQRRAEQVNFESPTG